MDAIEAVHNTLATAESVPVSLYRALYTGSPGGFGPWVYRINEEIQRRFGVKLRKRRDVYVPLDAAGQMKSADKHGVKALRQKRRQLETYDVLMMRPDFPEEVKVKALGKRDKAAASLADMSTKSRLRARVAALLEGPKKSNP
jgi:hypothetical protein